MTWGLGGTWRRFLGGGRSGGIGVYRLGVREFSFVFLFVARGLMWCSGGDGTRFEIDRDKLRRLREETARIRGGVEERRETSEESGEESDEWLR